MSLVNPAGAIPFASGKCIERFNSSRRASYQRYRETATVALNEGGEEPEAPVALGQSERWVTPPHGILAEPTP
jgi:hypothetical protein